MKNVVVSGLAIFAWKVTDKVTQSFISYMHKCYFKTTTQEQECIIYNIA